MKDRYPLYIYIDRHVGTIIHNFNLHFKEIYNFIIDRLTILFFVYKSQIYITVFESLGKVAMQRHIIKRTVKEKHFFRENIYNKKEKTAYEIFHLFWICFLDQTSPVRFNNGFFFYITILHAYFGKFLHEVCFISYSKIVNVSTWLICGFRGKESEAKNFIFTSEDSVFTFNAHRKLETRLGYRLLKKWVLKILPAQL
ncbi:hypothetical protein ACJX0J_012907 [Zea mays]